jgi:methylmalonyl-CoA/ethylmalonyl-CoA epimerase
MTDLNRINHVAVLVPDLDEALQFWQDQLGLNLDHIETIASMEVKIAFLPLGESEIELVQPLTDSTGLAKFLEKRGPGLHHICLEVDDISDKLEELRDKGVRLIDEKPVLMDDGRQLAFIHPKSTGGVLLELYELPPKSDI